MEKGLLVKIGLRAIFLLIITTLPSSGSGQGNDLTVSCWQKVVNCLQNSVDNLTPDLNNGLIGTYEYLCCSLIQTEWNDENECFCSINSKSQDSISRTLSSCGFKTFGEICPQGGSPSTPQSSSNTRSSGTAAKVIAIVIIVSPIIVVVLAVSIVIYCCCLSKTTNPYAANSQPGLAMEEQPIAKQPYNGPQPPNYPMSEHPAHNSTQPSADHASQEQIHHMSQHSIPGDGNVAGISRP